MERLTWGLGSSEAVSMVDAVRFLDGEVGSWVLGGLAFGTVAMIWSVHVSIYTFEIMGGVLYYIIAYLGIFRGRCAIVGFRNIHAMLSFRKGMLAGKILQSFMTLSRILSSGQGRLIRHGGTNTLSAPFGLSSRLGSVLFRLVDS